MTPSQMIQSVPDASIDELAGMADERLEAELVQLAANLAAGTARWFGLVAEYDRRRVWEQWDCRSMANWLAWHVGVSLITARQYVQVARTIESYPLLRAEFVAGRLSYSRVRAVCGVISPGSEAELVEMARQATAPQLERFVRGVERCTKQIDPRDDAAQHAARELALIQQDDATWLLRARLPGDMGTALWRALDAEIERQHRAAANRTAQPQDAAVAGDAAASSRPVLDPLHQRRADALLALIEAGHAAREAEDLGERSVKPVRRLVVVHRYPDGDELEDGPTITLATADRLAQDADVLVAVHEPARTSDSGQGSAAGAKNRDSGRESDAGAAGNGAGPGSNGSGQARITYQSVTRDRRAPTRAERRALNERDQGCRFPGCGRKGSLHAHHIQHRANHGLTRSWNLVLLCSHHHGAIHRNGWTITGNPNGSLEFIPRGRAQIPVPVVDIERIIDSMAGPIAPLSFGERLDLDWAIAVHFHNEHIRANNATTEREEPAPASPTDAHDP